MICRFLVLLFMLILCPPLQADKKGQDGAQTPLKLEVGEVTVIDTYRKKEFTRVNFTQKYDEPPLVFTLPTTDGSNAAAHRIRNVTKDGFDIMTLEPLGEDGPHISMRLNYLAIEEGVHILANGQVLEAGTVSTRKSQAWKDQGGNIGWESVSFISDFKKTPAVLGQIQTMNNETGNIPSKPSTPWLTTAIKEVDKNGLKIALERSESVTGSITQDEVIAYLAAEPNKGDSFTAANDKKVDYEIIRSKEQIQGWGTCKGKNNRVKFSSRWKSTPVVIATKNTRDGDKQKGEGDGGWLRRCGTSVDYVWLQVDEVRSNTQGDRNRTHSAKERAGIFLFSGTFFVDPVALDHIRIYHDGSGSPGVAEAVRIEACASSDCAQLYTGGVTLDLIPGSGGASWSGPGVVANQVSFSGGAVDLQFTYNGAGSVTLSASGTPVPANPLQCFKQGQPGDCQMLFANPGFLLSINDQVAGNDSAVSISTIDIDSGTTICPAMLQGQTVSVDFLLQFSEPASPVAGTRLEGTDLTPAVTQSRSVSFDDNCQAVLSFHYDDVGAMNLAADATVNGVRYQGNDSFVYYPDALELQVSDASGVPLDASSIAPAPIAAADAPIGFRLRALNRSGAAVVNYRPQAGDRIRLYLQRVAPTGSGTVEAAFAPASTSSVISSPGMPGGDSDYTSAGITAASFSSGVYQFNNASVNEVGLYRLYGFDSDYLGHRVDAPAIAVGRFTPARFDLFGSLVHRYQSPGCSGSSFSYLDETLAVEYQLTALSALGNLTRNYTGSFARFDGTGAGVFGGGGSYTLGLMANGNNASSRLQLEASEQITGWSAGGASFRLQARVVRTAALEAPLTGQFGVMLEDLDGVAVGSLDLDLDGDGSADQRLVDSGELRYGRLALSPAYGSELSDLQLPVSAQYFVSGSGFVTNSDDNCSAIAQVQLTDPDGSDALGVSDSCVWDTAGASGGNACAGSPPQPGEEYTATPVAGSYVLVLKAPGNGKVGTLNVLLQVDDWLKIPASGGGWQNPSGSATFGIYRQNPSLIYLKD